MARLKVDEGKAFNTEDAFGVGENSAFRQSCVAKLTRGTGWSKEGQDGRKGPDDPKLISSALEPV